MSAHDAELELGAAGPSGAGILPACVLRTRVLLPRWLGILIAIMDRDEVLHVLRAFEDEQLEYVLIGAAALGFHGIVRATEDIDLCIRATKENVERLKRAFRRTYEDDPSIDEIRADDLLGEYPAVRYYPPSGDLYFDVMTRLGEAASFETIEAQETTIEGVRVQVATPRALYRLKRDTVRPIDHRDAEALRQRFDIEDDDNGS